MKRAPKSVVQSVLARLRKVADTTGLGFNDALQMYVNERFLARLSRTKHAKTVLLKGALMLRVWGIPRARPTMDIDLLRSGDGDVNTLVGVVKDCAAIVDESDGVLFDADTVTAVPIRGASPSSVDRVSRSARRKICAPTRLSCRSHDR